MFSSYYHVENEERECAVLVTSLISYIFKVKMKRYLNLYTIIGFILIINLGTLAVLRLGNPQWSKFIYIFQCYYWPADQYEFGSASSKYYVIYKPLNFTGTWKTWNKNGRIESEENYLNDLKNGLHRGWYENGQIAYEDNYLNQIRHGVQREWYENGQIKTEEHLEDGMRHGRRIEWFKNGNLKSDNNYEYIIEHGQQLYWYENGNMESEENYRKGMKHGLFKRWFKNAQIKSEEYYLMEELNGPKMSFPSLYSN